MASTLKEKMDAKAKATQEFREKWHGFNNIGPTATRTDAVQALLNSNNEHFGTDTRNLEQYLTERDYDISAIIAGETTVPDNVFRVQTAVNEPRGKFWRVGNEVTTSSRIGASDLTNAIDRNADSFGMFDTGVVGKNLQGMQYFTINFDRIYKATEFKYKVSGQAWHTYGLTNDVKLELQHYDTDAKKWITDKTANFRNQKQPREFTISTSPTNSNSMRVKFSGGDHVLRVYEMQMFAKETTQDHKPVPVETNIEVLKSVDENIVREVVAKTYGVSDTAQNVARTTKGTIPEIETKIPIGHGSSRDILPLILIFAAGVIGVYFLMRKLK